MTSSTCDLPACSGPSTSKASVALPSTPVSRLLKSCATPPASTPMLSSFLRLTELLVQALTFRHVAVVDHDSGNDTVAQQILADRLDPAPRTISVAHAMFAGDHCTRAFEECGKRPWQAWALVRVDQVEHAAAAELLALVSQNRGAAV